MTQYRWINLVLLLGLFGTTPAISSGGDRHLDAAEAICTRLGWSFDRQAAGKQRLDRRGPSNRTLIRAPGLLVFMAEDTALIRSIHNTRLTNKRTHRRTPANPRFSTDGDWIAHGRSLATKVWQGFRYEGLRKVQKKGLDATDMLSSDARSVAVFLNGMLEGRPVFVTVVLDSDTGEPFTLAVQQRRN